MHMTLLSFLSQLRLEATKYSFFEIFLESDEMKNFDDCFLNVYAKHC